MILSKLADLVKDSVRVKSVIEKVNAPESCLAIGGIAGGAGALFCAALHRAGADFVFVATPSLLSAEKLHDDLLNFLPDGAIELLPPLDAYPYEPTSPSVDLQGQRLAVLNRLLAGEIKILVAPLKAFLFAVPPKELIQNQKITLKLGGEVDGEALSLNLAALGYRRVNLVGEKGEFAIRGGIIDVFSPDQPCPCRFELDGEKIASIREIEILSQRSVKRLERAVLLPAREILGGKTSSFFAYLPPTARVCLVEKIEMERVLADLYEEIKGGAATLGAQSEQYLAFTSPEELAFLLRRFRVLSLSSLVAPEDFEVFPDSSAMVFDRRFAELAAVLQKRNQENQPTVLITKHVAAVKKILEEANLAVGAEIFAQAGQLSGRGVVVVEGWISQGFNLEDFKLLVLSDYEIFGEARRQFMHETAAAQGAGEMHTLDLQVGDFVVHENYGIGRYLGLEILEDVESRQEYLALEYAGGDRLSVPLSSMGLVSKYLGGSDAVPRLDKMGSKRWQNTKARVKKRIRDMTAELLALYAVREGRSGMAFAPDDIWQKELAASFPFEETKDQRQAILEIKRKMEGPRPMDQLVCGDVGYGKTEVAIRAAVKAVSSGKQVAVLVPTTVLAQQHFITFSERLRAFPIKVEMLCRFRTKEEQAVMVADLKLGKIDIVIGTHRLLSKDVAFADLGLLIIDEEHRFGVEHKEKIKQLRKNIDVLTLSATPIPRTLYMALSGIRDLSMINTPPVDRSPVRTYVLEWNELVVKQAILREIERGGQVFFVHNLVQSIGEVRSTLRRLLPEVRVVVAHGQMKEAELEKNVIDFFQKKYDLLLCTAIIESGLDMPNVNTIIINQADRLGLAQLYQLRGRVGRSATRAYAYLFYNKTMQLTPEALKRLRAIQEFTKLGSGYKLALKDLEIRGAGNVLGAEQHGHLAAVGFDLYCELVEEAARELKGGFEPPPRAVVIDVKLDAFLPPRYVADERERIALYRRMNLLATQDEVAELKEEFKDRYGPVPKEVETLLKVLLLKIKARPFGIKSIKGDASQVVVDFTDSIKSDILQNKIRKLGQRAKVAGKKLNYEVAGLKIDDWITNLQNIFA